jgi:hypothetical protein
MTNYDKIDREIGCMTVLKVTVNKQGELLPDELEQIDEQMLEVGANRTGQRIDVTSTESGHRATIEYGYQETLLPKSLTNVADRIHAFTDFDDAYLVIDTQMVEYKRQR